MRAREVRLSLQYLQLKNARVVGSAGDCRNIQSRISMKQPQQFRLIFYRRKNKL